MLAKGLDATIGRQDVIVVVLGLLSAVIDNVPLVAATMGMYDLAHYPTDSFLWEFIAYCAGTGGSILIQFHGEPMSADCWQLEDLRARLEDAA